MQSNRFLQIGIIRGIKILLSVEIKQTVDFYLKKKMFEVIFNKLT
jgi:hypothetical protein